MRSGVASRTARTVTLSAASRRTMDGPALCAAEAAA